MKRKAKSCKDTNGHRSKHAGTQDNHAFRVPRHAKLSLWWFFGMVLGGTAGRCFVVRRRMWMLWGPHCPTRPGGSTVLALAEAALRLCSHWLWKFVCLQTCQPWFWLSQPVFINWLGETDTYCLNHHIHSSLRVTSFWNVCLSFLCLLFGLSVQRARPCVYQNSLIF